MLVRHIQHISSQCNILPFSNVNIRKSKQKQVRYNVLGVWYFQMRSMSLILLYKYVYKKTMKRYDPTYGLSSVYWGIEDACKRCLYIKEEAINPNRCCNPSHQVEPIFRVWVTSSHTRSSGICLCIQCCRVWNTSHHIRNIKFLVNILKELSSYYPVSQFFLNVLQVLFVLIMTLLRML